MTFLMFSPYFSWVLLIICSVISYLPFSLLILAFSPPLSLALLLFFLSQASDARRKRRVNENHLCVCVCVWLRRERKSEWERERETKPLPQSMPLRPAAGKHEPPSPPRQDQQQQHTHSPSRTHKHTHTRAASSSPGASTDSGSSQEEDSGVPSPAGVQAFRPIAEHHSAGAPMEEPTGNTVVIRIGIPDLQQTVRACFVVWAVDRLKKRGNLRLLLPHWQRLRPSLLSASMLYFVQMIFLILSVSST